MESLHNLMEIHEEIYNFAFKKDFEGMNKYISEFIPADSDNAEQRTLLVATKSFRDADAVKESRKKVLESLEKKIGPIA